MHAHRLLFLAALVGASAGAAQPPEKASTVRMTCPPSVELTYSQVSKLVFGSPDDAKLDIAGWQPQFAPTRVRLIMAEVNAGVNDKGEVFGNMPDDPGASPLTYTVWDVNEKEPLFRAHVMCFYEGGIAFQKPLPPRTRRCSLRTTASKPSATERSTREFMSTAEFSCQ